MKSFFVSIKFVLSAIGAFIASALGGWNTVLSLLVVLMVVDLITGFSLAVISKEVSSKKMRQGILRKLITFLIIYVGYRLDCVMVAGLGALPILWGISLSAKMFLSVYFCFEENISVLENCANLGVPFPKWLRSMLQQVSDNINDSTPDELIKLVKKISSFFGKTGDSNDKSDTDTNHQ